MKLKIFNVALLLFAGMMLSSKVNYAQRATQTDTSYKKMQQLQEQMQRLQKEMSDLRADMLKKDRDENKASDADRQARDADYAKRNEEYAKRNAEYAKRNADRAAENAKRIAERMAESAKRVADNLKRENERMAESLKRSSESFNRAFSNFSVRINSFGNDSSLQQKVQRGEVKEKTKSFSKSYPVGGGDKLQIDNRYGKVIVNTWDKNEFKVDVQIKAYANEDADAQKLLDKTSISDNKESGLVNLKTVLENSDNENNSWGIWSNNGKTTVREVIINYTIYMPAKNALDITNRYGGVELPNLDGKVTISNSYGGLLAKALNNSEDKVNVRYGNAKIASFGGNEMQIDYGNLSLDVADKLNATIRYGAVKIGKLSTSGNINLHYGGGLEVTDIDKNLKTLSINSSYAPVRLNSLTNADFDVTVRYGGFLYDSSTTNITSKTPADDKRGYSSTQNYKGHIGKAGAEKTITINSTYSTVKFN